jgi:RNA polymerase sigma-32 factor
MLEAVKRFDPERGFRLSSYATWWIRAQIQDYVLRSWSIVRLGTTASQRKLFFNLRRLKAQLRAVDDGDLSPEDVQLIAVDLNVSAADVVSMNGRLSSPDASLNTPLPNGDAEWQDRLVDESGDQESALAEREISGHRLTLLRRALALLEPREREIVTARRLCHEPTPLITLATRFRVTSERIRQIECVALAKLKKLIREMSRAPGERTVLDSSAPETPAPNVATMMLAATDRYAFATLSSTRQCWEALNGGESRLHIET